MIPLGPMKIIEKTDKITSGIYGIYCVPTGKIYIGSSKHISCRLRSHQSSLHLKTHANSYLQYVWDKYGPDNIKFLLLDEVLPSELDKYENQWIEKCKTLDREMGYNLQLPNGEGGKIILDETKEKMSQNHADVSGENNPNYGNHFIAGENNPMYGSHRCGKNNPNYGKPMSLENRNKISRINKGRISVFKGKHHTDEYKKIASDKMKVYFSNKNNHPMFGKKQSAEAREKMKLAWAFRKMRKEGLSTPTA